MLEGEVKILHLVPGLNARGNGIAVAAKLIAQGQRSNSEVEVVDTRSLSSVRDLHLADEVWVHSMWLPRTMLACWRVLNCGTPKLVRMTHANLDPVRLAYHGWKKRLAGPVERWLLRRADRVVVTCAAEREWVRAYEPGVREIEVVDLKRFFDLDAGKSCSSTCSCRVEGRPLHVLYLGRRHPLKGVEYLERAVAELRGEAESFPLQKKEGSSLPGSGKDPASPLLDLRIVSDHFGEELERDWAWCDVLCLPTLSENFGLVVAEALERGKRVLVTDGAPVWEDQPGVVYLKGYRDGTDEERVELLKRALNEILA